MQLAFDMDFHDAVTGQLVPWTDPDEALLARIEAAPWKVVDTETTGLNPASKPVNLSATECRRGARANLRVRVVSVYFPAPLGSAKLLQLCAFELDKLTSKQAQAVAKAAYSQVVFGWNVGFDAYWLLHVNPTARVSKLIDLMLVGRALRPEHVLEMAKLANDEDAPEELREVAISMFREKRSGWALRDVAANLLRVVMDKGAQGPKNWCEAFLPQSHFDYATGDAVKTHDIGRLLLGAQPGESLLQAYERHRAENPVLQMIEPQVADVVSMRRKGMPWSPEVANKYVAKQQEKVASFAQQMIEMVPKLQDLAGHLTNLTGGVTSELKAVIGDAFTKEGLTLELTDKTSDYKIGEKDLRKIRAEKNEATRALFTAWVGLNRAKKAAGMALEFSGFAQRGPDGLIHSNTGHGPITGRLSAAEPNTQQAPRDQGFRDAVQAPEGHKIVASDYSALDMRVGAALAIRAQQQIYEAYMGDKAVAVDVLRVIQRVFDQNVNEEQAAFLEANADQAMLAHKALLNSSEQDKYSRKEYWEIWRKLSRQLLLSRFQRCLAAVRKRAILAKTPEWGSLRDAFAIAGMDIHTWTALSMRGKNPVELFAGKAGSEIASLLKSLKKELGDHRQTGKVGNLSLLYAMQAFGLMEAAAKNYNIHWSLDEAAKVRADWLLSYVEIDLWHAWTELNPFDTVYVPDPEKGGDFRRKQVYASYTLGNRLIYALGLNAALSYEDQSTGADILGTVMNRLQSKHAPIFETLINQVHDELVFCVPDNKVESYTEVIQAEMVTCAEEFLMPYGVHAECSPAIGQVWLKD